MKMCLQRPHQPRKGSFARDVAFATARPSTASRHQPYSRHPAGRKRVDLDLRILELDTIYPINQKYILNRFTDFNQQQLHYKTRIAELKYTK